jgi:hypothetical protein
MKWRSVWFASLVAVLTAGVVLPARSMPNC